MQHKFTNLTTLCRDLSANFLTNLPMDIGLLTALNDL